MTHLLGNTSSKIAGLLICTILLVGSFLASIVYGFTEISWKTAIQAFTAFDESSTEHIVIQTTRTPRALIAAVIGASLAIAGALLQALTRNPLAAPEILGINAGAALFVVFSIVFLSFANVSAFVWTAFLGAATGIACMFILSSVGKDGLTPMKMVLAGAAITALFSSLTQGILVLNEQQLDQVLFWLAGSVAGKPLEMLTPVLPYLLIGWIATLFIAKPINLYALGEDVARGLGQQTVMVKVSAGLIIVLLAGSSVAVVGPIGFIGIIIPHIARGLIGIDFRWLIPYCALLGAILLLIADVFARLILMPQEVPVGVMTAIIGTPFFVYLARKGLASR
jgi:iron complex transport system permease protein